MSLIEEYLDKVNEAKQEIKLESVEREHVDSNNDDTHSIAAFRSGDCNQIGALPTHGERGQMS